MICDPLIPKSHIPVAATPVPVHGILSGWIEVWMQKQGQSEQNFTKCTICSCFWTLASIYHVFFPIIMCRKCIKFFHFVVLERINRVLWYWKPLIMSNDLLKKILEHLQKDTALEVCPPPEIQNSMYIFFLMFISPYSSSIFREGNCSKWKDLIMTWLKDIILMCLKTIWHPRTQYVAVAIGVDLGVTGRLESKAITHWRKCNHISNGRVPLYHLLHSIDQMHIQNHIEVFLWALLLLLVQDSNQKHSAFAENVTTLYTVKSAPVRCPLPWYCDCKFHRWNPHPELLHGEFLLFLLLEFVQDREKE